MWCSTPGQRYNWYYDYATYISYHPKIISILAHNGDYYKIIEFFLNIYQTTIYIFSAIGLFVLSRDKNKIIISLLPTIFLGGFLFHILWETKSIYVIQYYFLLLPFASYGIHYVINRFIEKKKELNP